MTFMRRVFTLITVLVAWQILAPSAGYAYLDPGTGSYILQMALAAVLGSLFAIKMFWKRIVEFLKALFSGKKNEEPQ